MKDHGALATGASDDVVAERDAALHEGNQPGNGVEDGGFATATWPDDRDELAGRDGKLGPVHRKADFARALLGIADRELLDGEMGHEHSEQAKGGKAGEE